MMQIAAKTKRDDIDRWNDKKNAQKMEGGKTNG